MKKIVSLLVIIAMLSISFASYALDIQSAYSTFKAEHPQFVNSLINGGIPEATIIAFISDVNDYLTEMNSYTPVTKDNFETCAIEAISAVSSREAYYSLQDSLIILYPDAIRLALTENKVHDDLKPLVATIKKILFPDDNPGGGGNGGGGNDTTKPEDPKEDEKEDNDTKEPENPNRFTDIDSAHWAYTPVSYLSDNFILNGYLDGTFKPESNITRAEFAKIIVSANNVLDDKATSSFNDVSANDWYYPYVSTAYKLGYITGYPDGNFSPDSYITRADICTIVNRVLRASFSNKPSFTDDSLIPSYAKDSVYALASKGIINGYTDGTFKPTTFATRAQTAKIIYTAFFQK